MGYNTYYMAIENVTNYLSKSNKVMDAFSLPLMLHTPPLTTLTAMLDALKRKETDVPKLGFDLFKAGVAYLAFYGQSPYIQDVGKILWEETESKNARVNGSISPAESAFLYGLMPEDAANFRKDKGLDDYPLVFSDVGFEEVDQGEYKCIEKKGSSIIFLPLLHFIIRVHKSPIENLAQLVWIGSKVRDARYGRTQIDPQNIETRAIAYQAHFLKEVIKKDPSVQIPELYRAVLDQYPEEIFKRLSYPSSNSTVLVFPVAK